MSYLTEKMAYIKGLAEGLDIDASTKEGKLLLAIVDALSDTADEIYEIQDLQDEMQLQLDEVDEDLAILEDDIYGEDDEDDEYSVECPACGDLIYLDAETLESCEDRIICPSCNEKIEIEYDCDCEGCSGCED